VEEEKKKTKAKMEKAEHLKVEKEKRRKLDLRKDRKDNSRQFLQGEADREEKLVKEVSSKNIS
jgi:hypothetical protein